MRSSVWKAVAVNSCLVVASTLAAVGCVEVLLPLLGLRPQPGKKTMFSSAAGFGHCYSSDPGHYWPLSLRRRPEDRAVLERVIPASEIDRLARETPHCILYDANRRNRGFFPERAAEVALVGDSFCFGEGLRDADTLGYLLGLSYEEYNFRNLGWPGTDVDAVYSSAIRALRDIPDLRAIVYFYNLNDIPDAHNPMASETWVNDLENLRWGAGEAPRGGGAMDLLRRSSLATLAARALTLRRETAASVRAYRELYLDETRNEGFLLSLRTLRSARDAARAANVELTVVIYPLLYKDRAGRYPFRDIHDLIARECRKLDIRCVDGSPAFSENRNLKPFTVHEMDFHPNGRANRLMVDYLARGDRLVLRTPRARAATP